MPPSLSACVACASFSGTLDHKPFECGHLTCSACVAARPRLGRYCIRCEGVSTASSFKPVKARWDARAADAGAGNEDDSEQFAIGVDSDDEGDAEGASRVPDEAPPAYDAPAYSTPSTPPEFAPTEHDQGGTATAGTSSSNVHYIKPTDTLSSLALLYRVPGHALCTLNSLPLSTLTTTPSLLHTKSTLKLPPGCVSKSAEKLESEEQERKRKETRRFMLSTKCADHATAKVYLELAASLPQSDKEALELDAQSWGQEKGDPEKRKEWLETSDHVKRAVEQYMRDVSWERQTPEWGWVGKNAAADGGGKGKGKLKWW